MSGRSRSWPILPGLLGFRPSVVFGMIDPKYGSKQVTVTAYARDKDKLPPSLGLSTTPVRISESRPATTRDGNEIWVRTWQVELTVSGQKAAGPGQEMVSMISAGSPGHEPFTIHTNWYVRSLYQVTPSRVFVRQPAGGVPEDWTTEVIVSRTDGQPFAFKSIDGDIKDMRIHQVGKSGKTQKFRVELDSTALAQDRLGEIVLRMDDALESVVKIPVAIVGPQGN